MTRETRHRSNHCDGHIFTCNRITHGELAAWQDHLHSIALEFDLIEEFKENGII